MYMHVALGSATTPTRVEHPEWAGTISTSDAAAITEQILQRGMSSFLGARPTSLADLTADGDDDTVVIESDGRSLRRSQNRNAVIVSLFQLIREGSLDPSVPEIADRAGVSHRSVFRYFDDLNDLVRLAVDHGVHEAMPLRTITDLGIGPLERRIDIYVETRLRVHARAYAVNRVAHLKAQKIPAIEEGLRALTVITRSQMAEHFALEFDRSPDPEILLDALMVLTSFEAYDYQRRLLGHNLERIRHVWHSSLSAQLTPTTASA
ncbi:MAG: AcrR family transcriptional regulator [Ilumatobacter sp.]|jgi:AcrR family transcriptional regulator